MIIDIYGIKWFLSVVKFKTSYKEKGYYFSIGTGCQMFLEIIASFLDFLSLNVPAKSSPPIIPISMKTTCSNKFVEPVIEEFKKGSLKVFKKSK